MARNPIRELLLFDNERTFDGHDFSSNRHCRLHFRSRLRNGLFLDDRAFVRPAIRNRFALHRSSPINNRKTILTALQGKLAYANRGHSRLAESKRVLYQRAHFSDANWSATVLMASESEMAICHHDPKRPLETCRFDRSMSSFCNKRTLKSRSSTSSTSIRSMLAESPFG